MSMEIGSFYLKLLQTCRNLATKQDEQICLEEIWTAVCKIAFNDTTSFFSFIPVLEQLSFAYPPFSETNPVDISASILKLNNSSFDINDRISSTAPLFALFPFLTQTNAKSLIEFTIDNLVVDEYLDSKLIPLIDTIEVAAIKPGIYSELFKLFNEKANSKLFETTIVFAPIAGAFVDNAENSAHFAISLFNKCFNKDNINKSTIIAGAFLAERLSQQYGNNPAIMPIDLFDKLTPYLLDADKDIQFRVHKAMRRLIECGTFDTSEKVKILVDQFEQYNNNDHKQKELFFKLISKYFVDTESISLSTVQPIFEFTIANIADFDLSGHLISILTSFSAINSDFIKELIKPLLVTVHQIVIQKIYRFYYNASETLYSISRCFGNEKIAIFSKDIDLIADVLELDVSSDVNTLTLSKKASICQSISSLPYSDYTLEKMLKFIRNSMENVNGNVIYPICTATIEISTKLSEEKATELFDLFSMFAFKETDSNRLNAVLETLRILYKTAKCAGKVVDFVNSVVSGKLAYFRNLPIVVAADSKSMLFHFISIYVRKSILPTKDVINHIIQFIHIVPATVLPVILEIIIFSIKDLNNEQCEEIINGLLDLIPFFKMYTEENDEIIATFDVLSTIVKEHPEAVRGQAIKLIEIVDKLTQINNDQNQVKEEEEEIDENEPQMDTISLSSAMKLICELSLCAPDEVNEELILNIVDLMPFPAESNRNNDVIFSLLKMCAEKEKFAAVYIQIITLFANIAVMKDDESEMLKISAENVGEMKNALKTAIKNDASLERLITKDFTRQKLNRFKSIYK